MNRKENKQEEKLLTFYNIVSNYEYVRVYMCIQVHWLLRPREGVIPPRAAYLVLGTKPRLSGRTPSPRKLLNVEFK